MTEHAVLPAVRPAFRAVATTMVPEASTLDDRGWTEMEALIERALADRPPRIRRQLLMFIRLVNALPFARFGRTFVSLDSEQRTRVLLALQRAPLLAVRRGVWGIRTLVFLGYYGRPEIAAALGYRAMPQGWEAKR